MKGRMKARMKDVSFRAFCLAVRIALYPWQAEAFDGAVRRERGRFVHRIASISMPRGNGKSFLGAAGGLWRLVAGRPGQHILSAALDVDGAKVVLGHARRIVRASPALAEVVELRADSLIVPATGSRWTITSREHTSSRGQHPDVVIYDEMGWARDDELFASLLAGQASVRDPLMLVISTVGRRQSGPLWSVKTLAEGGDPAVFWYWRGENLSPLVTVAFLERQRRILLPGQFAREHQNAWVDAADSYTTAAEVDAAMGTGWTELVGGRPDVDAVCFGDIGTVHDPTVIALGYEQDGRVYLGRLITFQGSQEQPVQLAAVERALMDLARAWRLVRIRIESWQGVSAVQSLQRLGLPVELFAPTAKANAEEWPVLAQRLAGRTISLFPHARLREELLNLVYEVGAQGVKVIDRGKVHQDHAVTLRGVCAMLQAREEDGTRGFEWMTPAPAATPPANPSAVEPFTCRICNGTFTRTPEVPMYWTSNGQMCAACLERGANSGDDGWGVGFHQSVRSIGDASAPDADGDRLSADGEHLVVGAVIASGPSEGRRRRF